MAERLRPGLRQLVIALAAALVSALALLVLGVGSATSASRVSAVVCNGMERWQVKTLADPDADNVKLAPSQIKHISVKTLRLKKKPAHAPEGRIAPVETTVYQVQAAMIKARWVWDPSPGTPTNKKGDRDIHLVIADPADHTLQMIVEFPDPACVAAQPALKNIMRDARNAFLDCKGLMPSSNKPFKQLTGTATINGVGFFDRPHATGHAPFGVELHPVLSFSSTDCQ